MTDELNERSVRSTITLIVFFSVISLFSTVVTVSPSIERPLLLVPGFGASILEAYQKFNASAPGIHLWEAMSDGDSKMRDYLLFKSCENNCARPESFNTEYDVRAPIQKDYGLYAVSSLHPFFKPFRYYMAELITFLETRLGYKRGVNLFAFPYDWRLDTRTLSVQLNRYVQQIRLDTNSDTIDIISHSFGGIVTKDTMLTHPIFSTYVNRYISIASPWKGNGMVFLHWLLGGTNFGNRVLKPADSRTMLLGSPSIYQLFSMNYYFPPERINGAVPTFNFTVNGKHHSLGFVDAIDLVDRLFADNQVEYKNVKYRMPFNMKRIVESQISTNRFMRSTELLHRIQPRYVFNIVGATKSTPQSVVVESNLNDINQLQNCTYTLMDMVSGDQLISYESAVASGFDNLQVFSGPYDHNGILKDLTVFGKIREYLGLSCPFNGVWNISLSRSDGSVINEISLGITELYDSIAQGDYYSMYGNVSSNSWSGEALFENGTLAKFKLTQSDNCERITGELKTAEENFAVNGGKVEGKACTEHVACPVENGKGVHLCFDGYASSKCTILSCKPGYIMTIGQPYKQSICIIKSPKKRSWPVGAKVVLALSFSLLASVGFIGLIIGGWIVGKQCIGSLRNRDQSSSYQSMAQ